MLHRRILHRRIKSPVPHLPPAAAIQGRMPKVSWSAWQRVPNGWHSICTNLHGASVCQGNGGRVHALHKVAAAWNLQHSLRFARQQLQQWAAALALLDASQLCHCILTFWHYLPDGSWVLGSSIQRTTRLLPPRPRVSEEQASLSRMAARPGTAVAMPPSVALCTDAIAASSHWQ